MLLHHIKYWTERNENEGRTGCLTQSAEQMTKYIPFLSPSQIKRELKRLVELGAIIGERNGFDRRMSYCLGTESSHAWDGIVPSLVQNRPIDRTESSHGTLYSNSNIDSKRDTREWNPPTEEEATAQLLDWGADKTTAQKLGSEFVGHYETTGWIVSGTPMHKWQPKLRVWLSRDKNQKSNGRHKKGFNPDSFTPEGINDFIRNG